MRACDDAAASFAPPPDVPLDRRPAEPPGIPAAPACPPDLVGHVDITPENVIFRNGRAHALIDFDLATLAARADEVFNAMLWWAPLSDPRDVDRLLRDVGAPRRSGIRAETQGGGRQRMWDEGVGEVIKRREAWLDRHAVTLTAALTEP